MSRSTPNLVNLPAVPDDLVARLVRRKKRGKRSRGAVSIGLIPEGQRNTTLFIKAVKMLSQGFSYEAVAEAIRAENRMRAKPSLPSDEIKKIIDNAQKLVEGGQDESYFKDPHFLARHLTGAILCHADCSTARFYRSSWWLWEQQAWQRCQDADFRAIINRLVRELLDEWGIDARVTKALTSNVIEAMSGPCLVRGNAELPIYDGPHPRPGTGDLLAMSNGLLDIEGVLAGDTDVLRPPTPAWFSLTSWPFAYDPAAKCPVWVRFLEQVLPDPAVRRLIQEFLGLCLVFDNSHHKFCVFQGEGANGKGVALEVMTQAIGVNNVSCVSLERFKDRFAIAPTIGLLANIVPEVGSCSPASEEILKAVVAGDRIQAEYKFKDTFSAIPTVRCIFATNETPFFRDRSGGLWRRILIIPFDVTIPPEKQDRKLAKKIIDKEIAGVFNWAIRGLKRLRDRGGFDVPEQVQELVAAHQTESNPAKAFLRSHCVAEAGAAVPVQELYTAFTVWCDGNGESRVNSAQFGREVQRVYPNVRREQRRNKGKRRYVYVGIGRA